MTITTINNEEFKFIKLLDQSLDISNGQSMISLLSETKTGLQLKVELKQVLNQSDINYSALRYTLTALNFTGKIILKNKLTTIENNDNSSDPRKSNRHNPLKVNEENKDHFILKRFTTYNSNLTVDIALYDSENSKITLDKDQPKKIDILAFVGSIQKDNKKKFDYLELLKKVSFDELSKSTTNYWKEFWKKSKIYIDGNSELNTAINYDIFQLNSSAGRDGKTSIAAKGLSGSGYEGHYFWDTEMYMLPFFIYTNPSLAKNILIYRSSILLNAIARAKTLGVNQGALFSWRTINGDEASAYYPGGTAQYHINGDIVFAIYRYWKATNDRDFMKKYGLKVIIETSKFWANFGNWNNVKFEFFGVTGPDEYTALVNNNYYTNRVAKFNIEFLVKLQKDFDLSNLISDKAIKEMDNIASHIYLPFNFERQINAQDDSFFAKPIWPFEKTPKENHPLLLHYHPLDIYRHQVNKQADTLLADYLFNDIPMSQLKREYTYYEKITTHDSSLSRSIFSILAARMGNNKKALDYFGNSATMDLTDLQGNTDDGLHLANLGGCWLSIVMGFAGMCIKNDILTFSNHLPDNWKGLKFRTTFQGRVIEVNMKNSKTNIHLIKGDLLNINVCNQNYLLKN